MSDIAARLINLVETTLQGRGGSAAHRELGRGLARAGGNEIGRACVGGEAPLTTSTIGVAARLADRLECSWTRRILFLQRRIDHERIRHQQHVSRLRAVARDRFRPDHRAAARRIPHHHGRSCVRRFSSPIRRDRMSGPAAGG